MIKMKIILVLTLILSILPLDVYSDKLNNEYLKVKIGSSKNISDSAILESENGFYLYETYDLGDEIEHIKDKLIIITMDSSGRILISDEDNDIITKISGDGSILIGSTDFFDSIVEVENNKYRDYITFITKDNNYSIINYVEMEHYLFGVVPREIPASSPEEALKAQAVVARSYAYKNMSKHISEGYNLCDTTHCQVYKGFDNEHPSTNKAVVDTYGDYVTYNGVVVETPYHSNSGGYTESSVNSWGGNLPYLTSVEDRFSVNSPNSTWTVNVSLYDMQSKLLTAGIDIGQIKNLELLSTTETGRVKDLKIVGSLGERVIKGTELQSILGLKSRTFTISSAGKSSDKKVYVLDGTSFFPREIDLQTAYIQDNSNYVSVNRSTVSRAISKDRTSNLTSTYTSTYDPLSFTIDGKGYGHGVGMSQYGAMEMAKQGYNYYDIITHYYSGVEILNLGK